MQLHIIHENELSNEIYSETCGKDSPMVLYGLLPHEQKMSLMNMVLRKHPSCKVPILNKQKLIFHVGYRRFEAQPIFSHHTNGDKFKVAVDFDYNHASIKLITCDSD